MGCTRIYCGEGCRHYRYKAAEEYLRTFNVDGDRNWRVYGVLWGFGGLQWWIRLWSGRLCAKAKEGGDEGVGRRVRGWWWRGWAKGGKEERE